MKVLRYDGPSEHVETPGGLVFGRGDAVNVDDDGLAASLLLRSDFTEVVAAKAAAKSDNDKDAAA